MTKTLHKTYNQITDKKYINLLALLCSYIYLVSYMARKSYAAVITSIVETDGIAKDAASIAVTGLFVAYAIGQIVSGVLGDKVNPKMLIFGGVVVSSVSNLLLPLNANVWFRLVVWCMNGVGQSMLWPPIVKILTNYMSDADYTNASVMVCYAGNVGSVALFVLAPLLISVGS